MVDAETIWTALDGIDGNALHTSALCGYDECGDAQILDPKSLCDLIAKALTERGVKATPISDWEFSLEVDGRHHTLFMCDTSVIGSEPNEIWLECELDGDYRQTHDWAIVL